MTDKPEMVRHEHAIPLKLLYAKILAELPDQVLMVNTQKGQGFLDMQKAQFMTSYVDYRADQLIVCIEGELHLGTPQAILQKQLDEAIAKNKQEETDEPPSGQ